MHPDARSACWMIAAWLATAAPSSSEATECGTPSVGNDGWQVASQESVGLDPTPLCALIDMMAATPRNNLLGVVIVRGGRLVFEHYRDGPDERWGRSLGPTVHGPDVLHDVRSIGKSVTSLLVGIALDRKLIASVDESVLAFFPEYARLPPEGKDRILLRHLLAMSSGLAWDENRPYSDPQNSELQMSRAADPYRFVLEQPASSPPDRVWNYSGGSTQLLAGIVQKASGRRLDDFAQEALLELLGITRHEWIKLPNGEVAAASGLRLRPRDMAKIGQLLLNGGDWHGQRIVSTEWLRASVLPRVSSSYGYQWWAGLSVIGDRVIERTEAKGLGGQRIFIMPALDMVVAVTAGLYIKHGIDNEGEITNEILDRYALPAVNGLATIKTP